MTAADCVQGFELPGQESRNLELKVDTYLKSYQGIGTSSGSALIAARGKIILSKGLPLG
jgi:hypothetical protein